jgi:phosphoribosylglycinamide formyltransferase 1
MKKLGILLSGRGSNFEAIAQHIENGKLDAEIAIVLSNILEAHGLERARQRGLETLFLPSKGLDRRSYDQQMIAALKARQVNLVCLAGFMRLLSATFIEAFPRRILNIHPSLLPAFPGLDAQRQALQYGARYSGCTVHFVDEGLDSGPIILQRVVPVLPDDSEHTLADRILVEEHQIYSQAIQLVLQNRIRIEARRVIIMPEKEFLD